MRAAHRFTQLTAAATLLLASTAGIGADALFPAIAGYGGIHPLPSAAVRPDKQLRYKLLFNITQPSTDPAKPNPSLEKVARTLNLLAHGGVKPRRGDVVAIVHGKATPLILRNELQLVNPNLALIEQLRAAGAEVHVSHEAMVEMGIKVDDVDPRVQIDVSALTTLATLQLRGYALIPD